MSKSKMFFRAFKNAMNTAHRQIDEIRRNQFIMNRHWHGLREASI